MLAAAIFTLMTMVVVSLSAGTTANAAFDVGGIAAAVASLGAFGLFLRPAPMLSISDALLAVLISLVSVEIVVRATHMVLVGFWQVLPGVMVLVVLVALALGLWLYEYLIRGPDWARDALRIGAAIGLGAAIVLASIHTAFSLFQKMLKLRSLRIAAEAEFVQSTLRAIACVEDAMGPGADKATREATVWDVEYTATILEKYVQAGSCARRPTKRGFGRRETIPAGRVDPRPQACVVVWTTRCEYRDAQCAGDKRALRH